MFIRDEGIRIERLCPLIEDRRAQILNIEKCERVWKYGKNDEEVETARRLLVLIQRRQWLLNIREEIVQWSFVTRW